MKKLIFTLLIGGFIMAGAFAASTAGTEQSRSTATKTAVVYFSATGTTERMAKSVVTEMEADLAAAEATSQSLQKAVTLKVARTLPVAAERTSKSLLKGF